MKKILLTVLTLTLFFLFSGRVRAQDFVTFGLTAQATACPTNPGNSSSSTSAVTLSTLNAGGATFTIGSSAFSGTVAFFASGDGGTTWVGLNVFPSSSTTPVTGANASGLWQANVSAYTHVCMVATAYSSGTITVTIRKSTVSARAGGGGGGAAPAGATNSIQTNGGGGALSSITNPTTPNSRAQVLTSTPSGGVGGTPAFALPGDSPTDRPSGEASYTIGVTDIGNSIRETNVAGEAFTIPDGNTNGFVVPVNIGFIIEGGTSTIARTTSSQIRCTPNGALVNTCTLSLGYQYILKETSDFNYTLSVSGDPGDLSANIYLRDEFVSGAPNTDVQIGELRWHLVAGAGASGAALAGVYPHVGIEQLNSGATASTRFHIQLANGANVFGALGGNPGWTATFIFKLEQTTNNRTFIGFTDAQDGVSAAIANGFYLRYDTNAGNADAAFKVVACSSSSCTTGGATYTVNTNWHRLVVTCLVSGQITFTLDNNAAQTISTNVPTATNEFPIFTEGNDTTASNSAMDVDFWGFSAQGVTRFP